MGELWSFTRWIKAVKEIQKCLLASLIFLPLPPLFSSCFLFPFVPLTTVSSLQTVGAKHFTFRSSYRYMVVAHSQSMVRGDFKELSWDSGKGGEGACDESKYQCLSFSLCKETVICSVVVLKLGSNFFWCKIQPAQLLLILSIRAKSERMYYKWNFKIICVTMNRRLCLEIGFHMHEKEVGGIWLGCRHQYSSVVQNYSLDLPWDYKFI